MKKIDIAREQLITALDLFLNDRSPVSVHSLAGNAREILERLCKKEGVKSFFEDIKDNYPDFDDKQLRKIVHQYRNAFKHADPEEDDDELLENFTEEENYAMLFLAVHDYGRLCGGEKMTMAMQVFEAWYLAINPEKMNEEWLKNNSKIEKIFSDIIDKDIRTQKLMLLELIKKYKYLEL